MDKKKLIFNELQRRPLSAIIHNRIFQIVDLIGEIWFLVNLLETNFLFHVLSTSWPHVLSIQLWTQENLPNFSHLLTHLPQLQISEIFCSYIFTHLLLSGAGHFPGWVRFKPNPKANPTLLTRNHSHPKTQTFGSGQVSGGYIASKIFSLLHLLSKN